MQNVVIWVKSPKGRYKFKYKSNDNKILNYLKLQVENSRAMGWPKKDIIIITNFPFSYMGVKAHEVSEICNWSAFANKLVFVNEMIERGVINDNFWLHDADAFQLAPFQFPEECKGFGYTKHSPRRIKPQGGSGFYKKDSFDIVAAIADCIKTIKVTQEESFIPRFYTPSKKRIKFLTNKIEKVQERLDSTDEKDKLYKKFKKQIHVMKTELVVAKKYYGNYIDRFSFLDFTYNLGIVKFSDTKYAKATKPIKVLHFHPEYPRCIEYFYLGKNKYNVRLVSDQLEELLLKYNFIKPEQKREKE